VPLTPDAPGHRDGDNVAEVKFTSLNRDGRYTAGTATCTNLYCHGNGQRSAGTASWITPGALTCTSCHQVNGTGMSGEHSKHIEKEVQCSACHSTVINAARTFIAPMLHINGLHEVKMTEGTFDTQRKRCQNTACHNGTRDWIEGGVNINIGVGGGDD
jgi:predicted CxxxxCH...CXXCH cytochrome family protein